MNSFIKVISDDNIIRFKCMQIENETSVFTTLNNIVCDEDMINISFDRSKDYFGIEIEYKLDDGKTVVVIGQLQVESNIETLIKNIM